MPKPVSPFASDPEYLEAEFEWLETRAKRLVAERHSREAKDRECLDAPRPGRSAREIRLSAVAYQEKESLLRQRIDDRLNVHRKSGTAQLGMDVLAAKHNLTVPERTVLLICCVSAFGQRYVDRCLSEFNSFYSSASAQDCIDLLAPETLADRLKLREMFRPTSALLLEELISIGAPLAKPVTPATLCSLEVTITQPAFGILIGDVSVEHEISETES